jgi:hypothetical protein
MRVPLEEVVNAVVSQFQPNDEVTELHRTGPF